MKLADYPKLTVIMRGYTYSQAMTIIRLLAEYKHQVAVEVTTNNEEYLRVITDGVQKFGEQVDIGVGTVLNATQAKEAIKAGAKFMLGPQKFDKVIFAYAQEHEVLTIPGAMTPSEVYEMFQSGADIVKIFPAISAGMAIYKQIQGPFGQLPLMAVGGVNLKNASDFITAGAAYLGIGSSFFNSHDVSEMNEINLKRSIDAWLSVTELATV
jgi:2-dehydro-3-deoxyphosphogluconate aldolase/(4S)-4-hydroxy-2-oxoglutarate aldolase